MQSAGRTLVPSGYYIFRIRMRQTRVPGRIHQIIVLHSLDYGNCTEFLTVQNQFKISDAAESVIRLYKY